MKRFLIVLFASLLTACCVFSACCVANPSSVSAPQPIEALSPCPATSCASGACHGLDNVPTPDGVHEMTCPESGCASAECHAFDTLVGRYRTASDASLTAWVVMPVVVVVVLVLLLKRIR